MRWLSFPLAGFRENRLLFDQMAETPQNQSAPDYEERYSDNYMQKKAKQIREGADALVRKYKDGPYQEEVKDFKGRFNALWKEYQGAKEEKSGILDRLDDKLEMLKFTLQVGPSNPEKIDDAELQHGINVNDRHWKVLEAEYERTPKFKAMWKEAETIQKQLRQEYDKEGSDKFKILKNLEHNLRVYRKIVRAPDSEELRNRFIALQQELKTAIDAYTKEYPDERNDYIRRGLQHAENMQKIMEEQLQGPINDSFVGKTMITAEGAIRGLRQDLVLRRVLNRTMEPGRKAEDIAADLRSLDSSSLLTFFWLAESTDQKYAKMWKAAREETPIIRETLPKDADTATVTKPLQEIIRRYALLRALPESKDMRDRHIALQKKLKDIVEKYKKLYPLKNTDEYISLYCKRAEDLQAIIAEELTGPMHNAFVGKTASEAANVIAIIKKDIKIKDILHQYARGEPRIDLEKELEGLNPSELSRFFMQLVRIHPNICLRYAVLVKNCAEPRQILLQGAAYAPDQALVSFSVYQDLPYALDILEEACVHFHDNKSHHSLKLKDFFEDYGALRSLPANEKDRLLALGKNGNERRRTQTQIAKDLLSQDPKHYPDFKTPEQKLLEDPKLYHLAAVKEEWIPWKKYPELDQKSPVVNAQVKAMIARYLFVRDEHVNETNVVKALASIMRARSSNRFVPLFAHRNILFLASNEKNEESDIHRFGTDEQQKGIRNRQGGDAAKKEFFFRRFTGNKDQLAEFRIWKAETLQMMRTIPPPFNFTFKGHGLNKEGIFMCDLDWKDALREEGFRGDRVKEAYFLNSISPDEFADIIIDRARNFPQLIRAMPREKDIFIFSNCQTGGIIHEIYKKVGRRAPMPNIVGESEYGQFAWTNYDKGKDHPESVFLNSIIKSDATLGNVMQNEFKSASKINVYIDDEEGLPIQIAEEKNRKEEEDRG